MITSKIGQEFEHCALHRFADQQSGIYYLSGKQLNLPVSGDLQNKGFAALSN